MGTGSWCFHLPWIIGPFYQIEYKPRFISFLYNTNLRNYDLPMIQVIAFDFGGTLFSTAKMGAFTPAMTDAFIGHLIREPGCNHICAQTAFEAYTKAWKSRRARGGDLPEKESSSLDLLQLALSEVDAKLDKKQMVELLNAFHSKEADLFTPLNGVVESLPLLAEQGYRLCVVSNNPWAESIRASFRSHGIASIFERLIISCDVGYRKPHRQIFEELLTQVNVPASEILFVGDSYTHDIEMPKKLGMKTCLVDFEGANKNGQRERAQDADLILTLFDQLAPSIPALG